MGVLPTPVSGARLGSRLRTGAAGVGLALAVAALLAAWLWTADRGLDRVDESYVLSYIANPDASRAAGEVNLFGFLLHPLYALVGADIAAFRRVFGLIVTMAAAVAALECLRCGDDLVGRRGAGWSRWLIALTAAAVSLTSFTFGLRSPSYYSVVFLGLLVAVIGFCRVARGAEGLGAVLLAVGWWVVFFGKPTSAAALAVVTVGALAVARRLSRRVLVVGLAATAVVSLFVLALLRMTPVDVLDFLVGGLRQDQLLGGHVDLLPLLGFAEGPVTGLVVFGTPIALAAIGALELVRVRGARHELLAVALVSGAALGISVVGLPSLVDRGLGQQIAPLGLVIPFVAVWAVGREVLSASAERRTTHTFAGRRTLVVLVLFLALLPYVEAVGSNSPFTGAMSQGALFWVLAAVVGLPLAAAGAAERAADDGADGDPRSILVILAVAVAVTAVSMVTALANGGSGASLLSATGPSRVAGGTLWLPPAEAAVAGELDTMARESGLTPGTPVVDLTGISAGYAFQLGGRPLGRESFMGVFPGAPDAAAYALARNTCEDRAQAWVLWAPDNPSDVSAKVDLAGRRVPDGYDVVGRFIPVQGPASWRLLTVHVLRPTSSGTACR